MVEPQIVVLDVAGSSPVDHPSLIHRIMHVSLGLCRSGMVCLIGSSDGWLFVSL